jgi:hypothetical protein
VTSLQLVELALALGLAWMGFRAPAAAARLLGAAIVVGLWALIADGSAAAWRLVGLRPHRRGLVLIAIGLILTPVVGGDLGRPTVAVSFVVAAALLGRLGLLRWHGLEVAADGSDHPPAPRDPPLPAVAHRATVARLLGRVTGRAGTIVAADVDAGIPRAARAAGRLAGRARRPSGHS